MALALSLIVIRLPAVTLTVERGSDLQSVIDFASDGDTIILAAKTFEATPRNFTDQLCGNCEIHQTEIPATLGFIVRDKALVIVGKSREESQLVTKAGYGIYFENSHGSMLKNLTVAAHQALELADGERNAVYGAMDFTVWPSTAPSNLPGSTYSRLWMDDPLVAPLVKPYIPRYDTHAVLSGSAPVKVILLWPEDRTFSDLPLAEELAQSSLWSEVECDAERAQIWVHEP